MGGRIVIDRYKDIDDEEFPSEYYRSYNKNKSFINIYKDNIIL